MTKKPLSYKPRLAGPNKAPRTKNFLGKPEKKRRRSGRARREEKKDKDKIQAMANTMESNTTPKKKISQKNARQTFSRSPTGIVIRRTTISSIILNLPKQKTSCSFGNLYISDCI